LVEVSNDDRGPTIDHRVAHGAGAVSRIAVFTGNPDHAVRKNIISVDEAIPGLEWLVLVHSPRQDARRLMRSQWRNLRRHGWRRFPAVARSLLQRLRGEPPDPDGPVPGARYTFGALSARRNVRVEVVRDLHAPDVLDLVRSFQPDLGLSLAAPILRSRLFAIPPLGTLNLHKGRVPDYRGMPPAFWELWNDENSVGCTIHWVEEKLDTGPVAAATELSRQPFSTVRGLQLQLDEVGVHLLRDTVLALGRGQLRPTPQPPGGRTYRQPTLGQRAELRRRINRVAYPLSSGRSSRRLKDAVKTTVRLGARALHSPRRATVLLYHRVADDARDNLTMGIEQFDEQMALLRRHFHVMSIEELLRAGEVPAAQRPIVCVTFDDGYLDNYTNAAPILMRHGVPAAFFVSTGIIATDRQFPHDIARGNPPIPVMNWDQVRELRDAGFTIGSHTVNHIDCAAEPEDVVRAELTRSRDDLTRELGLREMIFAYPYGGRHHMTPERLQLVKQAGYIGCLSAYGGTNTGMLNPFNVLRRGVHWEYSNAGFLLEAAGLSPRARA
jgi:peptidoglycan/xylan/chitin deacetylase (PgdA/CDA1 family)